MDGKGVASLLEHGIIQSILNLMGSSDAMTLSHCCRALYYLSTDASARKLMVAQGVVASIKPLARIAPPEPREDLTATLCRLSEEPGAIETLFFEGIDRTLARLYTTSGSETKRICSVAAFNLSVGAKHLKHFGDVFSQLLVNLSKQKIGMQTDAATTLPSVEHLVKAIYNVSLLPAYHSALLSESISRFMMMQIPMVPPSVQAWALCAFVLLCGARPNRVQLLSQQFWKLLKTALVCPDGTTQELAVMVLLLLSLDEGSRIKLCNWVPAAAIIQSGQRHLESQVVPTNEAPETEAGVDQARRQRLLHFHAYLLRNLCESVLTHHELIEEGAVPVLLAMSRADDITLKSSAISALCSIISSSADEVMQDIPEITEQLLSLTSDCEPERCEFAVTALYNISCCDDALELLGDSASLLQTVLRVASSLTKATLADLVSAIVYRLATVSQCAPRLLEHGYLPVLIQLIHRFPTCRTFALNALFLMAQFGGSQFPHGGEEIAQLVVALLSDGQETSVGLTRKGEAVTDPIMLRSAVTLLAHLASHSKNRATLVRNGSIFRFLKRMHRVNDDEGIVLTNCAFVLYCLTATQEGSELLAKERGIEDIIHLARTRTPSSSAEPSLSPSLSMEMPLSTDLYAVQELCMQGLCRLLSYLGLESRLIEQGVIQGAMVLALVKTDRTSIKSLCVKTLANCLVAKSCLRSLIDNGVVWALSSLCLVSYPASEMDTYAACANCLCNLSSVATMVPKFLDAGAPRALTHLLHQPIAAQTVLVVIKTIANLVANEKICQAFLNEDIERHLSAHFDSAESSDEVRQLAAMVLLRTTSISNDIISVEHLRNRVFRWMEQIVVMKEEELVRNCILTVHDLTCSPSIDAKELDAPHVLRILVQVLHRHQHNADIVTLYLSVVYNLSCELVLFHHLVQSDIMLFLRQQIPTRASFTLAKRDSRIVVNPSKSEDKVPAVAEGSQPTQPSQKSAAARLCCLILHNLSCSAATPDALHRDAVLVELVRFRASALLHDLYFSSHDDLKETSAIALCNIAVGKVNSTRLLEDDAHKVLVDFIYTPYFQPQLMPLSSAVYRKLCSAPGNQPRLLVAGIAKAMVVMLSCPEIDLAATRNILATLSQLSKCGSHSQQLADDGVLPCVVAIAEHGATSSELQTYCFEIISNLCTVRYDEEAPPSDQPEMNVISTLMKLSGRHSGHHQRPNGHQQQASAADCFYARGEGQPLPSPELLTYLIKSPSSTTSLKKNLELKATYTVPARKWTSSAQPTPKDPPALECRELPLADPAQALPSSVKAQIMPMAPLFREPLVRRQTQHPTSPSSPHKEQLVPSSTSVHDNPPAATVVKEVSLERALQAPGGRLSRSHAAVAAPVARLAKLQRGASGRHILERGWSSGD